MDAKNQRINIAIDGYSSCGKSTLARDLAKALNYTYVDSGAMYRAVTLYFLRHDIDIDNPTAVASALEQIDISFTTSNGKQRTRLNGEDVEDEIRTMEVSHLVSPVSALSAVRRKLVQQQRSLGSDKGMVMDGRDIGTVVFPDAEIKIFMTADLDERIRRRCIELEAKGLQKDIREIRASITERDRIDSTRSDSPLIKADDAILLDNTHLDRSEQLKFAMSLVENYPLTHNMRGH